MFPGSPAPLPPGTPVRALLDLMPARAVAGVWLRGCRRLRLLHAPDGRRCFLAPDLGALLRRCELIAVRRQGRPALLSASQLVRCRVLEIVLGTPFLPPPAQLRELYPTLVAEARGFSVPIGLGSAEEALAICAAGRIPVRSSRIAYAPPSG